MPITKDEIDYIDPDSKEVVYKSGRKTPLSEKAAFSLFASPSQKQTKEGVKETELAISEGTSPFLMTFAKNAARNLGGNFLADYVYDPLISAASGISKGPGQEDTGYFGRVYEDYVASRMGRREARDIMSQQNPTAATLGHIAALGLDIGTPLPKGISKSPLATGAAFGFAGGDRSLLEDPAQVAKSTAIGGGIGYVAGKAVGGLQRVAGERKNLRSYRQAVKEAEEEFAAKMAEKSQLETKQMDVYRTEMALADRKDAATKKAYEIAKREYDDLLELHEFAYERGVTKAGEKYAQDVEKYVSDSQKTLDKVEKRVGNYEINKESLGVKQFVDENIRLSEYSGTKVAKQTEQFINDVVSVLPEEISFKNLKNLFKVVDRRITSAATAQERQLLTAFRSHLSDVIPGATLEARIIGKYGENVLDRTLKSIDAELNKLPKNVQQTITKQLQLESFQDFKKSIKESVQSGFRSTPRDQLVKDIVNANAESLLEHIIKNESVKGVGSKEIGSGAKRFEVFRGVDERRARKELIDALVRVEKTTAKTAQKQSIDAYRDTVNLAEKIRTDVQAFRDAPKRVPLDAFVPPDAPKMGALAERPQKPLPVLSPEMADVGTQPEVGRWAERFETKPLEFGKKGTQGAGLYGLGKLVGMPGLGKAALAVRGGAAAMEGVLRGLTSPGAMADRMRNMASRDLVKVVVSEISSYPSYQNGVLTDPNDRRLAVANIEQNPYMQLQDKAMVQTYINRGKSLEKFEE